MTGPGAGFWSPPVHAVQTQKKPMPSSCVTLVARKRPGDWSRKRSEVMGAPSGARASSSVIRLGMSLSVGWVAARASTGTTGAERFGFMEVVLTS